MSSQISGSSDNIGFYVSRRIPFTASLGFVCLGSTISINSSVYVWTSIPYVSYWVVIGFARFSNSTYKSPESSDKSKSISSSKSESAVSYNSENTTGCTTIVWTPWIFVLWDFKS